MVFKKYLTGLATLLAMFIILNATDSVGVYAKSGSLMRPMETRQDIVIELKDDFFNPKVITVSSGKATTLVLKNKGKKEHTFTVEQLGIDAEVQPGKDKTISVKPIKRGTYELICRYHFNEGMVGKVIVN